MENKVQINATHLDDKSLRKFNLPPNEMKEFILNLKEPVVIRGGVSGWPLLKWNLSDWSNAMDGVKLPFRVGKRFCSTNPQWERTCGSVELSLEDFAKRNENGDWKEEWVYFDYKYMNQWFKGKDTILQSVSWKDFGFPEVHGDESTIWLGTEGAHTPCHYDSYSLNIVAQIYGRKMWVMFPPESSERLKPTRVPYEESSVYSKINFYCGNSDYSSLDAAYFVILEPGDALIVPNQWWHYVENLSNAISINTWIPLETDDDKRLEECLVRNFILSSIKDLSAEEQKLILNPNEEILMSAGEVDVEQLSLCVKRCKNQQTTNSETTTGKANLSVDSINFAAYKHIITVTLLPMDEVVRFLRNKCKCNRKHTSVNKKNTEFTESNLTLHDYINAFCHPVVISKVKRNVLNKG